MSTSFPNRMPVLMLVALIAACDGGPSESEMKTACLAEGKAGANKMMRKEMGIDSDAFCECIAQESRGKLSADGRQAMMLDMQGKKQEAHKISMKMNDSEQKAFMQGGMAIMQACMPKAFGK